VVLVKAAGDVAELPPYIKSMARDESLQSQVDIYLTHLGGLIRRGHEVHEALLNDPGNPATTALARTWQEDCGVTINQLSGGSKSHWLARSFSEAFLKRSSNGRAVEGAAPAEIVTRLLDVLEKAVGSVSGMGDHAGSASADAFSQPPPPHRFDFVHNPELRPVLEQTYIDSRLALEQGDYDSSLRTSSGIIEAIVTDSLEYKGLGALGGAGAPAGKISDWSFNTRLAVAERAGLIRNGCARLPVAARTYREQTDDKGEPVSRVAISERDARLAGQVLHVVMRDLDPGR
jgi:hypothetical protein